MSDEIIAEIRDVFKRPRVRRKFSALTNEFVDQFLAALLDRTSPVRGIPPVFEYERDPKGEPYINLAIAARQRSLQKLDPLRNVDEGVVPRSRLQTRVVMGSAC